MDRTQMAWLGGALGFLLMILLGIGIILPLIGHYGHQKEEQIKRESASIIPAGNWKRFYSKEGNFSVRFPGTPQFTNVTQDVAGFNLVQPLFYVWSDPQTEYAVNYTDYKNTPGTNLQQFTAQQQFDID